MRKLLIIAIMLLGLAGSATLASDWSTTLGVPADRLEPCPREDVSLCVHVRDGDVISVQIPSGATFEGWDGTSGISGSGPTMVRAAGLTVRRTLAVSPPPVSPSATVSSCQQESMIVAAMRPSSPDQGDRIVIVDVGLPSGFTSLMFDGQEVVSGPHVFRIYGLPVEGVPIVQGTWRALCGDAQAIALRVAIQPGDQIWDMRESPPLKVR